MLKAMPERNLCFQDKIKCFLMYKKNSLFQEIYIAGHHMIEKDLIRDVAKSQLLAEKELITSSN